MCMFASIFDYSPLRRFYISTRPPSTTFVLSCLLQMLILHMGLENVEVAVFTLTTRTRPSLPGRTSLIRLETQLHSGVILNLRTHICPTSICDLFACHLGRCSNSFIPLDILMTIETKNVP